MMTAWTVFGVELADRVIQAIRADAEARYPREACGLVLGPEGARAADKVVPLTNVAAGKDRFAFNDREHLEVLTRADEEGRVERVLYHSHPDAGAYLSAMDRAAIAPNGHPLMPDLVHVVVEVRNGRAGEIAAFRWRAETSGFEESHPLQPRLPDLELRGGRAEAPIVSVGGMLAGRRLGPGEAQLLKPLAEGQTLRLGANDAHRLRAFELGFLSPMTGFQRPDEARTIDALGRTPQGVPWRTPVRLEVEDMPGDLSRGQIVEVAGPDGEALGLMVMADWKTLAHVTVVGGPVFVYPSERPDARDLRADWLSMGANRVLALPSWVELPDSSALDTVDALLVGRDHTEASRFLGLPSRVLFEDSDLWLTAAMAQNQGATDIALPTGTVRAEVRTSLQIRIFGEP